MAIARGLASCACSLPHEALRILDPQLARDELGNSASRRAASVTGAGLPAPHVPVGRVAALGTEHPGRNVGALTDDVAE